MRKIIVILVLFYLLNECVCLSGNSINIFPKKGYGAEGEEFEVRVDSSNDAPFTTCAFFHLWDNTTVPGDDQSLIYWENEKKTTCKLIAIIFGRKYVGEWNVSLSYPDEETVSDRFSISMYDKPDFPTSIYLTQIAGTRVRQSCAYSINYVKIYNPAGKLYAEGQDINLDIPYVRFEDAGNWKCTVIPSTTMKEVYVDIFLNVTEEVLVEESVTETEDAVLLLCKHPVMIPAINYPCLFESPSQKVIAPLEGVVDGRYSYFGDDIRSECGLAVKKPLEDGDIGIWKCLIASPDLARYLHVGDSSLVYIRANATTNTPEVSIVQGMDLTIECSLRERITYCYARSPGGSVFSAFSTHEDMSLYTGRGLGLGHCQITVPGNDTSANDTGTWHCVMGTAGFEDELVPIEVTIAGSNFSAVEPVKEASYGDEALLMCRSVMRYTLRYCRFTHQSGRSFNVKLRSETGKFSSFSDGLDLEEGKCGLLIQSMTSADFGKWTCAAGIDEGGVIREYQDTIQLQAPVLSSSVILGLSIGLGIIVGAVVVGFIAYEHGRRNRRQSVLNVGTMQWEIPRRRLTSGSDSTSNGSRSPRISLSVS